MHFDEGDREGKQEPEEVKLVKGKREDEAGLSLSLSNFYYITRYM